MDIILTDDNDVYVQSLANKDNWETIRGLKGDDKVSLYQGTVLGGPGSDRIEKIPTPDDPWRAVQAAYWDSPGPITVDLEAGTAQDGWGGTDTLIGVRDVAGSWGGDNLLYGSSDNNYFYTGGVKSFVDGRAGLDTAMLPWFGTGTPTFSAFNIKVSIDGLSALITFPGQSKFELTLKNIENISLGGDNYQEVTLASLIKYQDLAIDGLVANVNNRWNIGKAIGSATELTYSFVKTAPASGVGADQFHAFTAEEQAAVKAVLAALTLTTGLSFREVVETGTQNGQLRFGAAQLTSAKGMTYMPGENGDAAGDVWMDIDSLLNLQPGSEGYAALMHEIGHALGLRHTRNVDATDHYSLEFKSDYDLTSLTVMSQTASSDGLFPASWGNLDIAALRYLYGSKLINTGNDVYKINDQMFLSENSLLDDGGIDTLDASLAETGATIDLMPGHLSSIGITNAGGNAVNNLSIGVNSVIENAIGTEFDDAIFGNDAANILNGGLGNDWIDGGKGNDVAVFSGLRQDYLISTAFGKTYVNAKDGISGFDTLVNIEALQFADQTLSLGTATSGKDVMINVDQNSRVTGQLADITDSEVLQYAIKRMPDNGTFELSSNGEYTYVPKDGFGADDSFTFTVTDSKGGTSVFTGFIQVNVLFPKINGGTGNDILRGTGEADTISGFAGNDLIYGNAGSDIIDGGTGLDTVVFSGKLSNYKINHSGSTYNVNAKSGTDGSDSLTGIEYLKFSDMTVNLTVQDIAKSAPPANVQRLIELYVAFFNRVPDADGLAYWIGEMKAGKTTPQIAETFYNAGVQFSSLTGFSASMSNSDFINVIYKNVLGRSDGADQGGLDYWNAKLVDGSANRGSLVSTILDAAHGFKGDTTWGWVANLLDNKIAVAKTFAIDMGLGYASSDDAIKQGMAIAAAVTPTDMQAALSLIGVSAVDVVLT